MTGERGGVYPRAGQWTAFAGGGTFRPRIFGGLGNSLMPNPQVLGTGSYLPEKVVDNGFLARLFGCDEDWILRRTGIRERRFAPEGTGASGLGLEASRRALEASGVRAEDLDLVVCATYTPDMSFPSTACLIQNALGARKAAAFDLQAACSGFVYGLITAGQFIASGLYRRVLVVASDVNSAIMNPADRKVTALFGDGAGAVVLGPSDGESGVIAQYMGADGAGGHLFCRPAGGSRMQLTPQVLERGLHYIQMDGPSLFRAGVEMMVGASRKALEIARLAVSDVDLFIPHQANQRMLDAGLQRLGIPTEKTVVNLDRYANTSAATIPIALDEVVRSGRVERDDIVLLTGFGAGLTWASAVIRWA